ncbi:MAG: 16S rRNA (cytidine(1402)-2'-O)-methyltransferase [candidate division Zixibacteria bacterium]|nr:16S rRNA (cytidine(1402)-2'-O)-methyltransferase [candidate division Zixibacteria bacterium]
MNRPHGKLYLVPTPIGNMGDITSRALEVLRDAELVACEDTRHSGQLLKKLDLKKRLISYHDFNERARADQLVRQIRDGASVAVITDAGSPGISDPAYRIVRAAIDNDIEIVPLPGPTAIIPALTASGLPTDRFFFEGFLPHKSAARRKKLERITDFQHTLVFYESPHRVEKSLGDMLEVLGDRPACLAREISKRYEQFLRGCISSLIDAITAKPVKGEIVLVVAGAKAAEKRGQ